MARSPLFRYLQRAFSIVRGAAARGVPAGEYAAMERERRAGRSLGRRRFLELGAAAATVPLFAGCGGDDAVSPTPGASPSVVVVGAGMAGLHCAYRLKELGVAATVYEADKRLGGRMFSDRSTFPDGMHCELGGELIDTGHQTMLDLATELGIDLYDYDEDDQTLAQLVAWIGGVKLADQDILDGFAPIAAKIDEAYATLVDAESPDDPYVYYNAPNNGEALDALSISAWLDSINATGPVRTLLEVAYNIEYGLETDVQGFLNLMFLISTDTTKLEIFGDSDERFHTKDGNDTFITKLAAGLDPGQLVTETALEAIRRASDGRYVLSFASGASAKEVTADHVVLALPFSILRELDVTLDLPAPKRLAIDELGYGTNAKLMCGFSSRPWRDTHGSNGEVFSDLAFQSTWETSRLQPGKSGILTNYTGGDAGVAIGQGTPEQRMADFLDELDQVFPGAKAASNGKVARMHWPTAPHVKASYACYKVGQYTTICGVESERFENVHFCGEHTSLDAQGYMEGAALTGAAAALEVGADLGKVSASSAALQIAAAKGSPAARILTRASVVREQRRWRRRR